MKTSHYGQNLHEFHQKCICQICTCQKHHCPHSQMSIPMDQITSYQHQYIKHPINTWKKGQTQKAPAYKPYGNISSSYQTSYPGHKPQFRQKIIPRVKDQHKDIPFNATSIYAQQYGPKKVNIQRPVNKDRQFNPDTQPFQGSTTYKSCYTKKQPNLHDKKIKEQIDFPKGYGFNGSTTYNNDFVQKKLTTVQNYKPIQKVGQKGPHDLNTIYRQDYKDKPLPQVCPILKMPKAPSKVEYPSQHISYNKHSGGWSLK